MSLSRALRAGAREFAMPASFCLRDGESVQCESVLRVLARKRIVIRGRWRGRAVLVKLIVGAGAGRRALRRELSGYKILRECEINTPELLRAGQCAGVDRGARVVLYALLPNAKSLGELLRGELTRETRLAIIARGLAIIARLHANGCMHTDPHLDNFLLANAGDVNPGDVNNDVNNNVNDLYVVDAAAISRRNKLCHNKLWMNKSSVNRARDSYSSWRRDNLAFYLARFDLQRAEVAALLSAHYPAAAGDAKLISAMQTSRRRQNARYLKKCFRSCTEFAAQKTRAQFAVWRRDEFCADLAAFLRDPDAYIARGEMLKDGNAATVVRVNLGGRAVVIKRMNIKHFLHRLQRALRATRSRLSWRNAHLLRLAGIATPRPIALLEKRVGPFRARGYFVQAYCDSPSAAQIYQTRAPNAGELKRFGELFAKLRAAGICHGDLKSSNLLVGDDVIALIDLDAMRARGIFPRAWRARCFAKDRRRFLQNWRDKPAQQKLFATVFGDE